MSADDIIVKICAISKLTADDIEGLKNCKPQLLADMMQTYIDTDAVPDHGVWVEIGNLLKQSAPYLAIGSAIIAIAGPLAALL